MIETSTMIVFHFLSLLPFVSPLQVSHLKISSKYHYKYSESSKHLSQPPKIEGNTKSSSPPSPQNKKKGNVPIDNRPHEQRVKGPRKARRLNHSFQHLYRHDGSNFDDRKIALGSKSLTSPTTYLREYGGFSDEMVKEMGLMFPPLLDLDVKRHLRPKMRFLKYTLGGVDETKSTTATNGLGLSKAAKTIPPQYFGARLEKVIAPRHAFLMYKGLPHASKLLENDCQLFKDFLIACRRTKTYVALVNTWRREYGVVEDTHGVHKNNDQYPITIQQVEAFDALFQRGMMAASRDDMDPQNQYSQHLNITSGQMINLLTKHGANPLETDVRDISLLHWASGVGNLDALQELTLALPGGFEEAVKLKADRDGATILHWSAAGAKPKEFGCGGHLGICRFLMDECGGREREIVNQLTKDGNSVLMWASWSGTLDVVKLMIRHRADALIRNRNGCTVAHWAASGGNLEVCKYLLNVVGVDFDVENNAGNSPLSHAVAYGRLDVVKWLQEDVSVSKDSEDKARDLALDFVGWDEPNPKRQKVMDLFNDWRED